VDATTPSLSTSGANAGDEAHQPKVIGEIIPWFDPQNQGLRRYVVGAIWSDSPLVQLGKPTVGRYLKMSELSWETQ
jgi:hypothetical protein